ncbi:hypothetical protein M8J71_15000 [Pseudarthrobacter sp. R1]|uniref:sunset domain-containing protein n=1 Tax=Pseudarthrobacter sp. R1 TaxID=2944934 RepID=UPI00210EED6F|nr:hypothetical protein [Pseudarthrobacter sp. R1]MCQ6271787.1 hypothetical protein [Pseudarthrobacter sp. R1]
MEAFFLIILLAVLVGVVWWRLNAKKSPAARGDAGQAEKGRSEGGYRADGALSGGSAAASAEAAGTTGIATAAGFGAPAEPAAPTTADEPAETKAPAGSTPAATQGHSGAGASAVATGSGADRGEVTTSPDGGRAQDDTEWETQWSEASGPAHVREGTAHREGAAPGSPAQAQGGAPSATAGDGAGAAQPVHHPEYTEPHAPTLPGAETAAVEDADDAGTAVSAPVPLGRTSDPHGSEENAAAAALHLPSDAGVTETRERAQSSALVETGANHVQDPTGSAAPGGQEPAGHLAAEEPYGAGSASAAADGTGPADYTVKGDAGAMVYYEEGHPEYEQIRAEVWFESAAHAEAAGFRAPRRRRF